MPQAAATAPTLERRLGSLDAAAIVVSNVIGGGILFTPPQVAATVPHPALFLLTWLAAGALAFAGAMAYAELAALRPRAGGEYVYLHAGFGRVAAFLTGWTSFVAGFSGAIAASSVVLAFYLGRFLPIAGSDQALLAVPLGVVTLTLSPQTITALVAIWLMSWIHLRGVGPGRLVGNVLASLKISAFVLFIVLGFAFGTGSMTNLTAVAGSPSPGSWLFALVPVLFTYAGWNAASYVAEEIRDPGRNVPRALALGTLAVVVIYLLLNTLYLYVLPVGELAAVRGSVLDVIADRLLGTQRRQHHGRGLDRQPAGQHQRDGVRRPARLLRHGPRRHVLPGGGAGAPALPHPGDLDRRAGPVEQRARALGRRQRAHHLHRVLDHPVQRRRRRGALRPAPARASGPAPVFHLGLSGGAGHLRGGERAHRRQRAVDRPVRAADQRPADGARRRPGC